jgi:CelD/BcsL family acetyltransferase involved in cellulose biosynthesis
MGYTVRECSSLSDVGTPDAWGALTARPPASLSGSRAWVAAALSTVDRDATPLLLAVECEDRLVGLLTLAVQEPATNPTIRFVGCPHNDLTDIIALPGHEQASATAAIGVLAALVNRGWSVDLDEVDPAGALVTADRHAHRLPWTASDPAPLIDLTDDWMSTASSQRRRGWDRHLRRLQEQHTVEFRRIVGTQMCEEIPEFLALRAARLQLKGHPLDHPPVPLIEAVIPRLAPGGASAFMEMRIDNETVARDLYLLDPPVAMLWLRALNVDWQRSPCGHLLLRRSAETLASDGYTILDLGRGDEPYKFVFGAKPRILSRASTPSRLYPLPPLPQSPPIGASVRRAGRRSA